MNDLSDEERESSESELCERVGEKEARKIRARARGEQSVWFGLGMFGIIGWSVAIPMLAALALGIWIDRQWPSRFSWTLMLLFAGIILGCANAWYWVSKERREIETGAEEEDD